MQLWGLFFAVFLSTLLCMQDKWTPTITKAQRSKSLFVEIGTLSLCEGMHAVLKRRQQKIWCTSQVSYLCKLDIYVGTISHGRQVLNQQNQSH